MQKKGVLRFVSAMLSMTILAGSVYCKAMWQEVPVWAMASAELQAQKDANNAEIAEMQKKLEELGADQASAAEYQKTLNEKLDLQQKNIAIVDEQLSRLEESIFYKQQDISATEIEIVDMESDISVGLEEFKTRIRAMYISGNNSLASALVGATDFFDFLSKYDMISRVAKHDNDMVNNLQDQLIACNEKKEQLEQEKAELDVQLEEQTQAKKELGDSILQLQEDYEQSVEHSEQLEQKQKLLNADIADLEAANLELDAEDARIQAAILAAQEEERRKQEEAAAAAAATTTTTRAQQVQKPTTTVTTKAPSGGNQNTQAPVQTTVTTTTTAAPVYESTRFAWPCPGFYVLTSGFGPRWGTHHSGIDISSAGIGGASVVASRSGTVIYVNNSCSHNYAKSSSCGCGGGYGNYVIVQHDDGYSTVYAHLTSAVVSYGQSVSQGQLLGYVGSTGFSTGDHLHFEVRINGTRVDPEQYLY